MKQLILRFSASLWALLAALLLLAATALPAAADDGDMDEITNYTVTVETLADGSAYITYELDWNVIGGSMDDPLTWVRIGMPNSHNDNLVNLTPDTVERVSQDNSGGSFVRVEFRDAYYSPDDAAKIGAQSSVHFAFQVHQSHLFLVSDEGTADYSFTPGWFDDLCVDNLTVRWIALDEMEANNDTQEGNYLVWHFGPLGHGESATVNVSVPAKTAQNYSPDAAATDSEMYYDNDETVYAALMLAIFIVIAIVLTICYIIYYNRRQGWSGGFGADDPNDWYWYSNGNTTIHVVRTLPPPEGYHRIPPPPEAAKQFKAGGGSTRGGGAGRRSDNSDHSNHSSCACACACVSSCACACACAGGGRAGCSAKNFYKVTVKKAE